MRPFKILDILFAYYIVIRGNLGGSAVECSSLYFPVVARKGSERIIFMRRDLMYSLVKKRNIWNPDLTREKLYSAHASEVFSLPLKKFVFPSLKRCEKLYVKMNASKTACSRNTRISSENAYPDLVIWV